MDEKDIQKAQGLRLEELRRAAGWKRSRRAPAIAYGWPESTYSSHERGTRTIGQDDAEKYAKRFKPSAYGAATRYILFGTEEARFEPGVHDGTLRVVGRIGAGALIEPDVEQVPDGGLFRVRSSNFVGTPTMMGFLVDGDSMGPRYEEGDILVCTRTLTNEVDFLNREVALQTKSRKRYIKIVRRGSEPGLYDLASINPAVKLIEDVQFEWVARISTVLRSGDWEEVTSSTLVTNVPDI